MPVKMVVIAHDLRSSHNVGSLLRTGEGLGVEKVIFTGYTPYPASKDDTRLPHIYRKIDKQIDKTALGAQDFLAWQHEPDLDKVLASLKSEGYTLCGLEQSLRSIQLHKFKAPAKVALVIGNEVKGLDPRILDKLDNILEIPMLGHKESFNVIQASAMALFAFRFMNT